MGTRGNKMKQLIAIIIAGIVLSLYIAAAATTDWVHASGPVAAKFGAFRYDAQYIREPGNYDYTTYTYTISPDCSIHSSVCDSAQQGCGSMQPNSACSQVRAVEGFLILALVLDAVVLILMCIVRFGGKEISPVAICVLLGLVCIFAIISFSIFIFDLDPPPIFITLPSSSQNPSWMLGAGSALMLVACILSMANIHLWHLATKGTT